MKGFISLPATNRDRDFFFFAERGAGNGSDAIGESWEKKGEKKEHGSGRVFGGSRYAKDKIHFWSLPLAL